MKKIAPLIGVLLTCASFISVNPRISAQAADAPCQADVLMKRGPDDTHNVKCQAPLDVPFTPAADQKGTWHIEENAALPNVLILGDSISIGYTLSVRERLQGKTNLFRPLRNGKGPDNCGDTTIGLTNIDKWLGERKWDVIHFNWGLWDLCYRHPESKEQGNRDKIRGTLSTTPEKYEENLEKLVARLKKTGASLIWANTTLVPEGEVGRNVGDDDKYNAIARRVMERNGIPINDLHTITKAFPADHFAGLGDVHFTKRGSDKLAEQVATKITEQLLRRNDPAKDKTAFEQATDGAWKKIFSDPCTTDWKQRWHLDGEVGTVKNEPQGMVLSAGPEFKNDSHHMVLWTKVSFEGDVKIEYDFTRLDESLEGIILLYIQATGSGGAPYHEDIMKWNELRKVPAMDLYFNNMNLYHISFATNPGLPGYLRGRRYMPNRTGLLNTALAPEYTAEELLGKGVTHQITIIKKDRDLYMRISNPNESRYYHITNTKLPAITKGHIGIRQMFTRSARYANFSVSVPEK